jgi:hypothetical protein
MSTAPVLDLHDRGIGWIRRVLREEYERSSGENQGEVDHDDVIAVCVDRAKPYVHLDLDALFERLFMQEFDRHSRGRKSGMRRAEITHDVEGQRVDKPFVQLCLFEAEEVAIRKIEHGEATELEGRRDLAVFRRASERATALGLDPHATRICDVLSDDEIASIRAREAA